MWEAGAPLVNGHREQIKHDEKVFEVFDAFFGWIFIRKEIAMKSHWSGWKNVLTGLQSPLVKMRRHFKLDSTGEFFPWDYFCSLCSLSWWMMEEISCAADTQLGRSYNETGGHNKKKSDLNELEEWSGPSETELFWEKLELLHIEIQCIKTDCTINAERAVQKNRNWGSGLLQTEQANNMLVFWERWIFG